MTTNNFNKKSPLDKRVERLNKVQRELLEKEIIEGLINCFETAVYNDPIDVLQDRIDEINSNLLESQ